MQNFTSTDFAAAMADDMIAARFHVSHGVKTFSAYLDLVDQRATAHLNESMARRVCETAGAQRRRARLQIENAATLIIAVPMKDPRTGATVWAELEFWAWLNVIEMGADGAWFYTHKSKDQRAGQVRTNVPLKSAVKTPHVTVARLLVNAKAKQQARVLDNNPLNLRASNVYLRGNPNTCEGRAGRAKTDSRAQVCEQKALRQALAGAEYGIPAHSEEGQ